MTGTNVIIFPAGAYGTYLHWALDTLMSTDEMTDPGKNGRYGNSHGFNKNHLRDYQGWIKYLKNEPTQSMVRFHPKTSEDQSIVDNLQNVLKDASKVIHLYPDHTSYLLNLHNYLYKIWNDLWNGGLRYINLDQIYSGWGIDKNIKPDQIPVWIKREFFSYNIFNSWEDQVEWYFPDVMAEQDNYKYVFVNDLLYDFKNTITKVQQFFNLDFVRCVDELLPFHQVNVSRQKHINQQPLAESIVDAVINKKDFMWQPTTLSIFTEAWIQRQLFKAGFGLKCDGLDIFPTNSLNLKKLTYLL